MSGTKRHFVWMGAWVVVCCGELPQAGAQHTAQIILSVAPPADTSITGNEEIAIEGFVIFNQGGNLRGQFGFPCSITSGATTLTATGISTPNTSANGTVALCIPGLAPISIATCFGARSPLPLGACNAVANTLYYMTTITYDVSDCASDPIDIHADPLGVADGVPAPIDKTRFYSGAAVQTSLIPIVSETFVMLVPGLGTCCVDGACVAGGVNQYCCENGLYGGSPGTFRSDYVSCSEPGACQCIPDMPCDDGDPCTDNDTCTAEFTCEGNYAFTPYGDLVYGSGRGIIDVDDLWCVLLAWVNLSDCPQADVFPCGGDTQVDLDDLVALLASFNGDFACEAACPMLSP
ncbi:MAG: hypothetical protein AABZ47_03380 [Planctomycetota bacterium]